MLRDGIRLAGVGRRGRSRCPGRSGDGRRRPGRPLAAYGPARASRLQAPDPGGAGAARAKGAALGPCACRRSRRARTRSTRIGILCALRRAGERAMAALPESPDAVLLDGSYDWLTRPAPTLFDDPADDVAPFAVTTRIKADLSCAGVAAASVLAKTERDRLMVGLAVEHPEYGWVGQQGLRDTADHRAALREHGPVRAAPPDLAPAGRDTPGAGGRASALDRAGRGGVSMSAEDLERYETEMELSLYKEYRDVVGLFALRRRDRPPLLPDQPRRPPGAQRGGRDRTSR